MVSITTLSHQKLEISLSKSHLLLQNDTALRFRERLRNRVVIIIGDASFYHHHLGNYFPSALLMSVNLRDVHTQNYSVVNM